MTRVLVVAMSAVTRAGLEAILAREPAITVVGADAISTTSLLEDFVEYEPDVIVIELGDGALSHAYTIFRVLGAQADEDGKRMPAIVILTDEDDGTRLTDLINAGVRAVLPRNAPGAEIVAAVTAAAAGLLALAPDWARGFANAGRSAWNPEATAPASSSRNGSSPSQTLTARELEVLRMLSEGLANKQIAARLGISEHTVKFHVGSVFTKLGASTRAEAVMIGARQGLIVV